MSSIYFQVATIALDNGISTNFTVVPSAFSFATTITPTAQLVQTQLEPVQYAGLLYTPSIGARCIDTQAAIPRNLTLQQLPTQRFLIALAPASNCRDSYVSQATEDGAKAIILYPPTSDATPVGLSLFTAIVPVYYASWIDASSIALAMNRYNTDLKDVPFGTSLSSIFAPDDQIRLLLSVTRTGSSARSLPGLWIVLLIVLGILCLVVAATSIAMHTHQYIARRDLRRRIAAGEVDLESLGIKNLTVPPAYIKALPQRKWHEPSPTPLFSSSSKESMQKATPINSLYNQTNCSICLEDYVASTSNIRELPCQHIYHLECIDPFLSKRSSLCPLCKQSVLPKGYIPPKSVLTIATVMRERRRRRAGVRGAGVTQSSSADLELQAITDSTNRSSNQVSTPVNDTVIEETNNHQPSAGRRIWTSLFPGRG